MKPFPSLSLSFHSHSFNLHQQLAPLLPAPRQQPPCRTIYTRTKKETSPALARALTYTAKKSKKARSKKTRSAPNSEREEGNRCRGEKRHAHDLARSLARGNYPHAEDARARPAIIRAISLSEIELPLAYFNYGPMDQRARAWMILPG